MSKKMDEHQETVSGSGKPGRCGFAWESEALGEVTSQGQGNKRDGLLVCELFLQDD